MLPYRLLLRTWRSRLIFAKPAKILPVVSMVAQPRFRFASTNLPLGFHDCGDDYDFGMLQELRTRAKDLQMEIQLTAKLLL